MHRKDCRKIVHFCMNISKATWVQRQKSYIVQHIRFFILSGFSLRCLGKLCWNSPKVKTKAVYLSTHWCSHTNIHALISIKSSQIFSKIEKPENRLPKKPSTWKPLAWIPFTRIHKSKSSKLISYWFAFHICLKEKVGTLLFEKIFSRSFRTLFKNRSCGEAGSR